MTRILAIDTASSGCSAAYFNGDDFTFEMMPMERGQAEHLVPLIGRVLEKAGAEYKDIERIAVTTGPGAFTGLRIGLSAARALGLALDVPVGGIPTMDVIARKFFAFNPYQPGEALCILLETRRSDFYVQFEGDYVAAMEAADIARMASHRKIVFAGDALARFQELQLPEKDWRFVSGYEMPDPCFVAFMALEGQTILPPEPLYLRGADVTHPKNSRRGIVAEEGSA